MSPKPVISVSVRQLVEFVLRRGDLGGGGWFSGRDRALAGTRGHQRVQRSRPDGYEKEVPLSYDVDGERFTLRVQGRLDGVLVQSGSALLEEIKTVQGRWDQTSDGLHWAQLKCYAFIYAHDHQLKEVSLRLCYLHLDTGKLTEFIEVFSEEVLRTFFQSTATAFREWISAREDWRQNRDESIAALAFPFEQYRPGQREIAVAAYKAIAREESLFVEAPTGIGKTAAVLYPAVKALSEGLAEQIFYLTARGTARAAAEQALTELRRGGLRIRSLLLTAKEKVCQREGQPCDPQICPLTRGYYDRHKAAMRQCLAAAEIDRGVIGAAAQAHQVCPFELSLDVSSWVDVILCDYNYVFDPQVYLKRHFADDRGRYIFLIDEAHNLVDRAREMFSANLSTLEIREVRRAMQGEVPRGARAFGKLLTGIRKLAQAFPSASEDDDRREGELPLEAPSTGALPPAPALELETGSVSPLVGRDGVRAWRELPADLLPLVDAALEESELWLLRNDEADFRSGLLDVFFQLVSFRRTAERYDGRYRTLLFPGRHPDLKLFCVDPALELREASQRAKSAVFFSATLSPLDYYRELLGGEAKARTLQLPSPFPPERLLVLVQDRVRTQYHSREATLWQVAQAIGTLVEQRRGNYLVYLPSYQYLESLQHQFRHDYPMISVRAQRPGMSESDRADFLSAFASDLKDTQVGFAVLGGIFGEGVDLVGDRLIGAAIVGVGLPQLCAERDLIRDYFQEKMGSGFDYAYTFPGMNRVLQATGRVIRSESDRGVVLLIDTRYGERRYAGLLPSHWRPSRARHASQLSESVERFWRSPA